MVQKMIRASFFRRDPLTCARELIGTELIWGECSGVVVEVEAYAAIDDEAAHTFTRPSARSFIERNKAGTAYVYFNYGMYWLFNGLVKGGTEDGFVLIRALEPIRGIDLMQKRRFPARRFDPDTTVRTLSASRSRCPSGGSGIACWIRNKGLSSGNWHVDTDWPECE